MGNVKLTLLMLCMACMALLICKRSNERELKIEELRDSIRLQSIEIDSLQLLDYELWNENEMLRVDIMNLLEGKDLQLWKEINR